jgi:hypothetical protein
MTNMKNDNYQPQRCDGVIPGIYTRRQMLKTFTTGFGYMAFAGLAAKAALLSGSASALGGSGAPADACKVDKKMRG